MQGTENTAYERHVRFVLFVNCRNWCHTTYRLRHSLVLANMHLSLVCFLGGTGRVNQRRRCGRRVEPRGRGARACVWSRAAAADEQGAQTAHSSLMVLSKCCWVGGVVCVTSDTVRMFVCYLSLGNTAENMSCTK